MNEQKIFLVISSLFLALTLVFCFTLFAAASSIMTYSFKSDNNRELDWNIARTLHYGEPEHNYYYDYYIYDNEQVVKGTNYESGPKYEGGSTNVWVNGTLENGGYIETDVNAN